MNPTAPFTRRDLGGLQQALDKRLETLAQEDAVRRIWAGDHTFWKDDPAEITDRLGWLTLHDSMRAELPGLRALADECAGFQRVVLLGMGGSSLAPEVLSLTYGGAPSGGARYDAPRGHPNCRAGRRPGPHALYCGQ